MRIKKHKVSFKRNILYLSDFLALSVACFFYKTKENVGCHAPEKYVFFRNEPHFSCVFLPNFVRLWNKTGGKSDKITRTVLVAPFAKKMDDVADAALFEVKKSFLAHKIDIRHGNIAFKNKNKVDSRA